MNKLKNHFARFAHNRIILLVSIVVIVLCFSFFGNNIGMLASLLFIFLYNYLVYGHMLSRLGIKEGEISWKIVLRSFLIGLAISLGSFLVLLPIVQTLTGIELNQEIFEPIRGNLSNLLLFVLIGWLVGGLIEEIIFRGFLQQQIERLIPNRLGLYISLLMPSLFFGTLHAYQGITGQILTFIIGFILAIAFWYSKKNLLENILIHGFVNTSSFVLLYFSFDIWFVEYFR